MTQIVHLDTFVFRILNYITTAMMLAVFKSVPLVYNHYSQKSSDGRESLASVSSFLHIVTFAVFSVVSARNAFLSRARDVQGIPRIMMLLLMWWPLRMQPDTIAYAITRPLLATV